MSTGSDGPKGAGDDTRLSAALDRALAPWKADGPPFTLLFSGGVDSALLAWELRAGRRLTALTIGRPGSPDLAAGRVAADRLGLRWTSVEISDEMLARTLERIRPQLDRVPSPLGSVFLALAVGIVTAPTRAVLCGQGIDELFLGYAHFRGLGEPDAGTKAADDLRRLKDEDWPRSAAIARRLEHDLAAPYLDPGFMEAALAVPLSERLPASETKGRFRRWALGRGLPETVAGRPKRALQYGTGVARWWDRASGG